jgi:hypothetical protein
MLHNSSIGLPYKNYFSRPRVLIWKPLIYTGGSEKDNKKDIGLPPY